MSSAPASPGTPGTPTRLQDLLAGNDSPYGSTVRRISRGTAGNHIVELNAKIEQLTSDNEELKQQAKGLKAALKATEDDAKAARASHERLDQKNVQLAGELDRAGQQIQSVREALEMERSASQTHMRENGGLRRDLSKQAQTTAALRKDRDAHKHAAEKVKRFTDLMMETMRKESDELAKWKALFADYKELVANYLEGLNNVARGRIARTEEAIANSMLVVDDARDIIRRAKLAIESNEQ